MRALIAGESRRPSLRPRFMEGLVRLSVLRHKGTKDVKDTGMTLPDCIENLMTDHVLKYGMQVRVRGRLRVRVGVRGRVRARV